MCMWEGGGETMYVRGQYRVQMRGMDRKAPGTHGLGNQARLPGGGALSVLHSRESISLGRGAMLFGSGRFWMSRTLLEVC